MSIPYSYFHADLMMDKIVINLICNSGWATMFAQSCQSLKKVISLLYAEPALKKDVINVGHCANPISVLEQGLHQSLSRNMASFLW